jgi:heat-inducible transcriptional repressor
VPARVAPLNPVDASLPLDSRKQQILKAVVADYTQTGIPVGSQALAAKHLVSWSAATIRNELATMVEIGYLLQPHTSAGRIPSDRGYRYYVDFLMEEEAVPTAVRRQVDPHLPQHPLGVEELLEAAAQVLAMVTDAVSIVTGPRSLAARLKHLDVVSLDPRHALLLVLLDGNLLRQQAIELVVDADQQALTELSLTLNRDLAGLTTVEIAHLAPDPQAHACRAGVLEHLLQLMSGVDARQDTVVVHDGFRNLLHQPEFGDLERLEQVLDVVEQERALGQILASLEADGGLSIVIGAESGVEQLRFCSLVLTTYRAGETRRGTIGVLGPTRMRYSQVAPRLRYVAQRAGQAIDRLLG